jgi:hypothetical protein
MKYLVLAFILLANTSSAQKKPITFGLMFDIPVEKNLTFNGLNLNAGAWFGNDCLVPIGVFGGYRVHQPVKNAKVWEVITLTLAWKIQIKEFLILPNFTYANKEYQDLGIKFGYALDKEKTYFFHLSFSGQLGPSIGTTISIN